MKFAISSVFSFNAWRRGNTVKNPRVKLFIASGSLPVRGAGGGGAPQSHTR